MGMTNQPSGQPHRQMQGDQQARQRREGEDAPPKPVVVKTTNPQDNPDHEERQRDHNKQMKAAGHPEFYGHDRDGNPPGDAQSGRDAAENKLQQAQTRQDSFGDASPERKASEAQQGRGAAGQNTGPSNTTAADPHNPGGYPTRQNPGGAFAPQSQGMGQSPPQGSAPKTDKPEATQHPGSFPGASQEQRDAFERQQRDQQQAGHDVAAARSELSDAEGRIAGQQERGEYAKDRDRDKRDDHRR